MAREMGIKTIPVVFVNIPSETKERELLLRMNANQGAWNYDLLKLFDIDLLLDVGFDDADLSQIFDENLEIEDDNFDTEKELAAIKETDIKPGDMFALGKHMLICNDSTQPATAKMLLGKLRANVINTDVPYNIGLSYDRGMGNRKNYGGTTNDAKSGEEYKKFLKNIIENALSVSHKDCHVFIWHDEKYVGMVQKCTGKPVSAKNGFASGQRATKIQPRKLLLTKQRNCVCTACAAIRIFPIASKI